MYKNRKSLESILPHRGAMVLIDRVKNYDLQNQNLTAEVDVIESAMFFDDKSQQIPIWVGLEYMAQTIGAFSGIYCKEVLKQGNPKFGFIIGSRNYQCLTDSFKQGQTLNIFVQQLFFDSELGAFECEIMHDGKLLAKAQINVFQPESLDKILQN